MRKGIQGLFRWLLLPRQERKPPLFQAQDYARQRRLGYPLLKFFPELEQEYRDSAMSANIMRLRFTLAFGVLAILGFIVMDAWLGMSLQPGGVVALLLVVSCPGLIVPGLLSFVPVMRPHLYRILFWGTMTVGVSMVAVIILGKIANPWFPYDSILLVTFYSYSIGLLLRQSLVCGSLFMLAYVGLGLWLRVEPAGVMLYDAYYMAVANGIGAIVRYIFEYQDRLAFLMQRELAYHAHHDALTGLLNRRAFRRSANAIWAQAAREGTSIGLMLLDLDEFKAINDEHGHLVGDEVLIKAARTVEQHLRRPLDAGGRFGGDELVAVWYGPDPEWFIDMLTRMHALLGNAKVESAAGILNLRVSIGAVTLMPKPGDSLDRALHEADARLYEVKRAGGHRVLCSHLAPDAAAQRPSLRA